MTKLLEVVLEPLPPDVSTERVASALRSCVGVAPRGIVRKKRAAKVTFSNMLEAVAAGVFSKPVVVTGGGGRVTTLHARLWADGSAEGPAAAHTGAVLVRGLLPSITPRVICKHFSNFGSVSDVAMCTDERGAAVVVFAHPSEAYTAAHIDLVHDIHCELRVVCLPASHFRWVPQWAWDDWARRERARAVPSCPGTSAELASPDEVSVSITGVPADTSDEEVRSALEICSQLGCVQCVERDGSSLSVGFSTPEAAALASNIGFVSLCGKLCQVQTPADKRLDKVPPISHRRR
eukprot:Rhum_TRINITY_DN23798_c0_g2::Rhum_TRINITY_DN23798_c0_g2_i1::g.178737::m.178737